MSEDSMSEDLMSESSRSGRISRPYDTFRAGCCIGSMRGQSSYRRQIQYQGLMDTLPLRGVVLCHGIGPGECGSRTSAGVSG